MARAWLINSSGIAKTVRNATLPAGHQIEDGGATRECPNCLHCIDNSDVSKEWPGLPLGVKFDPSDVELLEHLAAKCGVGNSRPHVLIDEFIPTLEGEDGICYTHPKNLPGAKKDGSCVHFFYRTSNAYASGQRKRRRIQEQENMINTHVRWHKTGKTKPVMENSVQKGFKKILVLYASARRGIQPESCNWVMHQYHLGTQQDETEGEYVVSKVFYNPQKEIATRLVGEESDRGIVQVIPRTPMSYTPEPPRVEYTPSFSNDYEIRTFTEEWKQVSDASHNSSNSQFKYELENNTEETEATHFEGVIDSYAPSSTQVGGNIKDENQRDLDSTYGLGDLENWELDTPPGFHLPDLQDSLSDWFDLSDENF